MASNIKSQHETKRFPHGGRHFQKIYGKVLKDCGPIIIFEIFSDLGPLLSKWAMGLFTYWKWPQNHCQNWVGANLLNIRLFDRFKFRDFFDPLVWGHYHLIGFGWRLTNWVKIPKIEIFLIFGILRPKVAFIRKFFPTVSQKRFNVHNTLKICKIHPGF